MIRPRWILLLMWVAGSAFATSLARFQLVLNEPSTPEHGAFRFGTEASFEGRVHLNGVGIAPAIGLPFFHGPYSQSGDDFAGLDERHFPTVFLGGWSFPHDRLDYNFDADLQALRQQCLPDHHWLGSLDTLALTTLLRFDGSVYHAAQYIPDLSAGIDTVWHVPWTTLPLPIPAAPLVIWVEGVTRVKGVVSGQVTVLAADSLFIMGDLITADTDTVHASDPVLFGCSPAGSPHRIGLVGEKDIILAATLENGWANGAGTPNVDCGLSSRPVIWGNGQARRDVMVHASLLARCTSFETEFWKTTAFGATVPPVADTLSECPGPRNTHVTLWDDVQGGSWPDCPGAVALNDRRGTLWFSGSVAAERSGFLSRNPWGGPWGQAYIGYFQRRWDFDDNLLALAPPGWPELRWLDDTPVQVTLNVGAGSNWGEVDDPAALALDWAAGQVRLEFEALGDSSETGEDLRIQTWINGLVVDSAEVALNRDTPVMHWTSSLELSPWLAEPGTLHVEVQRGIHVGLLREYDLLERWNEGGALYSWTWQETTVIPARPATALLSQPWPNPFNPVCHVTLELPHPGAVTLEVFDLLGRRVALLQEGPLAAGSHEIPIDGSGWAAGLQLLRVTHAGGVEMRKLLLVK
ncbi:MAG: hypothetical protein WC326_08910 [Candidatus Delongbacteria bacterium]